VPNQPITWITDPTRFDFGNVDKDSMLIAPTERSDVTGSPSMTELRSARHGKWLPKSVRV